LVFYFRTQFGSNYTISVPTSDVSAAEFARTLWARPRTSTCSNMAFESTSRLVTRFSIFAISSHFLLNSVTFFDKLVIEFCKSDNCAAGITKFGPWLVWSGDTTEKADCNNCVECAICLDGSCNFLIGSNRMVAFFEQCGVSGSMNSCYNKGWFPFFQNKFLFATQNILVKSKISRILTSLIFPSKPLWCLNWRQSPF